MALSTFLSIDLLSGSNPHKVADLTIPSWHCAISLLISAIIDSPLLVGLHSILLLSCFLGASDNISDKNAVETCEREELVAPQG
jgi:hypothetical protein